METLSKIYDEHEWEMLPFFCDKPPDRNDENCHETMGVLWARATAERFYLGLEKYGITRKYLKSYALKDTDRLTNYAKERGWI